MTDTIDVAGLTDLQAKALRFVDAYIREHGTSPSVDEVRGAMGVRSKSSAHRALKSLRTRGKIQWSDRLKRSITLVSPTRAGHVLPPNVQAELERFCIAQGEEPSKVVADAVLVHLDELTSTAEAFGGCL